MNTTFTLDDIKLLFKLKKYQFANQPYKLNIVGIRAIDKTVNIFNDMIYVFFTGDRSETFEYRFNATTDPGMDWLKTLLNPNGTAVLVPGQYQGAYQLALHQGKYKALCQRKPVKVYRDKNRDDVINFNANTIEEGIFGINIHRANLNGLSTYVGKHSAGCQVIQKVSDFNKLIELAEKHKASHGNTFTYTLIEEKDIKLFLENKNIK